MQVLRTTKYSQFLLYNLVYYMYVLQQLSSLSYMHVVKSYSWEGMYMYRYVHVQCTAYTQP